MAKKRKTIGAKSIHTKVEVSMDELEQKSLSELRKYRATLIRMVNNMQDSKHGFQYSGRLDELLEFIVDGVEDDFT